MRIPKQYIFVYYIIDSTGNIGSENIPAELEDVWVDDHVEYGGPEDSLYNEDSNYAIVEDDDGDR